MSRRRLAASFWTNRTLCAVLEAMRDCQKTMNFSYLSGLIEEAQYLANRMESAISDARDINELRQIRSDLKKEVKELEVKVGFLKDKAGIKDEAD